MTALHDKRGAYQKKEKHHHPGLSHPAVNNGAKTIKRNIDNPSMIIDRTR